MRPCCGRASPSAKRSDRVLDRLHEPGLLVMHTSSFVFCVVLEGVVKKLGARVDLMRLTLLVLLQEIGNRQQPQRQGSLHTSSSRLTARLISSRRLHTMRKAGPELNPRRILRNVVYAQAKPAEPPIRCKATRCVCRGSAITTTTGRAAAQPSWSRLGSCHRQGCSLDWCDAL